jgi:IclR family transcriptional regulator, mhp operon transcriptional activator
MRSVERTLSVLAAISAAGPSTLNDLHISTDLPRPSLLRILATLVDMGYVRRGLSDAKYRVTSKALALAQSLTPEDQLAELAAPYLDRLCDQLRWPSDLAVFDATAGDCMLIAESSLRKSRFYVRRAATGARVNVLASAVGIAYLSALTEPQRLAIVRAARGGGDWHNLNSIASGVWQRQVERSERLGFAFRADAFRGGRYMGEPEDDGLDAIAVPVALDGLVAAVNVTWNRKAVTRQAMKQRSLPVLIETAGSLQRAWASTVRLIKP